MLYGVKFSNYEYLDYYFAFHVKNNNSRSASVLRILLIARNFLVWLGSIPFNNGFSNQSYVSKEISFFRVSYSSMNFLQFWWIKRFSTFILHIFVAFSLLKTIVKWNIRGYSLYHDLTHAIFTLNCKSDQKAIISSSWSLISL